MKIDVKRTVNVRRRYIVDGREYASVEEMPGPVREVYEEAMGGTPSRDFGQLSGPSAMKIVVNGREYESDEAMPPEVRRLYDEAMRMARTGEGSQGILEGTDLVKSAIGRGGAGMPTTSINPRTIAPQSGFSSRRLIVCLALLVLLGCLFYLMRDAGIR